MITAGSTTAKTGFFFLNFGSGHLKLISNLTIDLIGKTHVILQAFLFGTNTLQKIILS